MTLLKRLSFSAGIALAPGILLTAAALGGRNSLNQKSGSAIRADAYTQVVWPIVRKYCLGCHSTSVKKGSLDLERFAGPGDIRKDLKPWQGVIEHLEIGDMPPRGMPQPTESEKRKVTSWVKDFLAGEARAQTGDPGYVPLRRLSNAEYNCTIRDLTGVDLQPARQFPVDGAAGEGFTNAAEALTDVSPALLTKYFNAAKDIADHAVLLPDGMRFSSGKTRRDWTDESTARLRQFYAGWTGPEGRLDFTPYLTATVRYRADLASLKTTVEAVASKEKLNAKYLKVLWTTLTNPAPSYPLDSIRAVWRRATEKDVPGLAADIAALQGALWQTVRVGSYMRPVGKGYAESFSRQLGVDPDATDVQSLRLAVKPIPGQSDVIIRLASKELGSTPGGKVLWQNPRFEGPGKPSLLLRDYSLYGSEFEVDYPSFFGATSAYLNAAAELARKNENPTEERAKSLEVDLELLKRWIMLLNLTSSSSEVSEFPGRPVTPVTLDLLTDRHQGDGAQKAISGWQVGAGLPTVLSNASNTLEHIPGDAAPHSVVVHPTPTEFVGVAWTSPISGRIRITARINHAHPACGNGVAWWLEQRRVDRASMFAEGLIPLGGSAAPEAKILRVEKGDTVLLAIDAKNGDHGCDLTQVSFTLTEQGSGARVWDLASDVADSILAGNPHPDRYGNARAWAFVKGPTRSVGAGTPRIIPPDSLLDEWRRAVSDPSQSAEARSLAGRVQALLSGRRPVGGGHSEPNKLLYDALAAPDGPLLRNPEMARLPMSKSENLYGLPIERFNSDGSLVAAANKVTDIRVPAALLVGREFIVEAKLDLPSPERAMLFQASAAPIGPDIRWDGKSPIVANPAGEGYKRVVNGIEQFRDGFPLFLCFPNVIPNDEVVSLKMFHREDDPLKKLFLNEQQARQLDRLWTEHYFISRQAVAENKYLPLFIGFVTQDQPKEMVAYFEGQRPAFRKRADDFEKEENAAIPRQLERLKEFTSRAYRRPMTGKEISEQAALYRTLRAKGASHDEAFRGVLARVLVAPSFLFRIEQAPSGRLAGPVNDWELSSRLSYFLWSSSPDAELRRLASSGKLHLPAVLAAETRRMINDSRIRSLAVEFGAQWLHVRGFDELSEKNERLFPTFDADLRKSIYEETILFFQDLFQADQPIGHILDADYVFANETLAKHYAIAGVSGPQWRRISKARQYGRGGVLGLASVQAKESGASRTSPVLRGNWIVETLLGEKMPRPPAIVPKLPEEEGSGSLTIRQQVEKHSKVPECAVCHRRMDPYGFALERYDPIGRLRDKDMGGLPVDARAKLKDGTEFDGIDGLRNYLLTKKRDVVIRLFCRRLLGYAVGRSVANSDQPLIDQIVLELNKNGGRISAAVLTIVKSPQFRMIRGRDFGS